MWTSVSLLSLCFLSRVIILEPDSVSTSFLLVHFVGIPCFIDPLVFQYFSFLLLWIEYQLFGDYLFCKIFALCLLNTASLRSFSYHLIFEPVLYLFEDFPLKKQNSSIITLRVWNTICLNSFCLFEMLFFTCLVFLCFSFFKQVAC